MGLLSFFSTKPKTKADCIREIGRLRAEITMLRAQKAATKNSGTKHQISSSIARTQERIYEMIALKKELPK